MLPSASLPQSRSTIPLVLVLRVEDTCAECERPSVDYSGFELCRLLLNRLKVRAAALQGVKELHCMAANAPRRKPIKGLSTLQPIASQGGPYVIC